MWTRVTRSQKLRDPNNFLGALIQICEDSDMGTVYNSPGKQMELNNAKCFQVSYSTSLNLLIVKQQKHQKHHFVAQMSHFMQIYADPGTVYHGVVPTYNTGFHVSIAKSHRTKLTPPDTSQGSFFPLSYVFVASNNYHMCDKLCCRFTQLTSGTFSGYRYWYLTGQLDFFRHTTTTANS